MVTENATVSAIPSAVYWPLMVVVSAPTRPISTVGPPEKLAVIR